MSMSSFGWLSKYLVVVVVVVRTAVAVALYPYGAAASDVKTPESDDGSSPAISALTPFKFNGTVYNTFYVNNDGSVTFSGPATFGDTTRYSSQTTTTVCGFCADINIANGGTVWYRQTQDATLMADLAQIARNYDIFGTAYTPTSALVATWEAVADFKPTPGMLNTFQVVLASDGQVSMVVLLYPTMTWIRDTIDYAAKYPELDPATLPKIRTQAGFLSGDGNNHLLDGSWSLDLINVTQLSDIGEPGKYLFRVDTVITEPTIATTTTTTTVSTTTTTTEPTTVTSEPTTVTSEPTTVTSEPTTVITSQQSPPPLSTEAMIGIGVAVCGALILAIVVVIVVNKVLLKRSKRSSRKVHVQAHQPSPNGKARNAPAEFY